MALTDWLLDLGIRAEKLAERGAVRSGAMPLLWPPGDSSSFIYRLPRDPRMRAGLFASQQTVVVSEGQVAVVLDNGVSNGALAPGRYTFSKARVVASLDIVWVKTSQQAIRWGVGNVSTLDGIEVSANGELFVRVVDAVLFNTEMVQGAITLAERDVQRKLVPRISRALTSEIARTHAQHLQMQQDEFEVAVSDKLAKHLAKMGLGIVSFELANINFPAEFKAAWSGEKLASLDARKSLVEAETYAQITQLKAGADAQAKLLDGMAEVQLLTALQGQGFDPMQFKAMEAMKLLAENPSQGGIGSIGGDVARTNLIGQLAVSALATQHQPSVQAPRQIAPAPPQIDAPTVPDTAAKILALEDKIEALGDRLSAGEITESAYDKLVARLERKLERLEE